MDNKTLAKELITRYAGLPHPMRGMIQEAARRLLQMAPDHKSMAGKMEADGLRKLAAEWPLKDKPWITPDFTADDWLRCTCTAAADRIEQMAETIDYARTINAENVRLTAELAKVEAERDALKIDKLNLTAMVEQLENSYGQLQEINDRTFQSNLAMGEDLKVMKAERDALVEQLRMCARDGLEPCDLCRFGTNPEYSGECDFECATCANNCPCRGCKNGEKWEWRGAKDNNVPGKTVTDTNVGSKEEE